MKIYDDGKVSMEAVLTIVFMLPETDKIFYPAGYPP